MEYHCYSAGFCAELHSLLARSCHCLADSLINYFKHSSGDNLIFFESSDFPHNLLAYRKQDCHDYIILYIESTSLASCL